MTTCFHCRHQECRSQGTKERACESYEDDEPQFEVYTFNESTGSENIHLFYTQEAADAFIRRQPQHKMAH